MIFLFRQTVAEVAQVRFEAGGELGDGDAVAAAAAGVGEHALPGGFQIRDGNELVEEIFHKKQIKEKAKSKWLMA